MSRYHRTSIIFNVTGWSQRSFQAYYDRGAGTRLRRVYNGEFDLHEALIGSAGYVLDYARSGLDSAISWLETYLEGYFIDSCEGGEGQLISEELYRCLFIVITDMAEVIAPLFIEAMDRNGIVIHEEFTVSDVLVRNDAVVCQIEDLGREVWH